MNETKLIYCGDVCISIKINDKFYTVSGHNTGEDAIKVLFSKALIGDLEDTDLPDCIDLERMKNQPGEQYSSFLQRLITISSRQYLDNDKAVSFQGNLSYDLLSEQISEESQDLFRFVLYTRADNQGKRKKLATIPVDVSELKYITPGTAAILSWSLRIMNKGEI